jgi:hypothetical protein
MLHGKAIAVVLCAGFVASWGHANAQEYSARLSGFSEVGPIPTVVSPAAI